MKPPKSVSAEAAFEKALKDPDFKKAYEKEVKRLQKVRGSKGGKVTLERHGTNHFSEASKTRWEKK